MSKKIIFNELYNSVLVNKFINCFQKKGKKSLIENKLYNIFLKFKKKKINSLLIFFFCIELIKPTIIALPSVKSGMTHYVGSMLTFQEQYFTAIRWFANSIFLQKGKNLELKIVNEMLNTVFFFRSTALKRKKDNYSIIFKNRALTHYRWR